MAMSILRTLVALCVSGILASPLAQTPQASQSANLDPYPGKPRIVFRKDGTLKITVFSDLHFGENPWDWWGPEHDLNSTKLMKRVLKDEKPDYAVINGDLITGENTFKENSTLLIDQIVAPLNAAKVPFSSTHGNHDNQPNITHAEEIARELKVAPLSYTRTAPAGVGGEGGPGNYWVPRGVLKPQLDRSPSLVIWFFDSRGGFSKPDVGIPDFVDTSVAPWIASETQAMNEAWGPGITRSSLAFVHIPPHYIEDVQYTITPEKNPGLNADELGLGSVQKTDDIPFWGAVKQNLQNLVAVISGHDHGNEWCAREPTKDIVFCFDKHSGYGGYTGTDWGYGVRNLVFHLSSNTSELPKVESWIRLEEGETRAHVWIDDTLGSLRRLALRLELTIADYQLTQKNWLLAGNLQDRVIYIFMSERTYHPPCVNGEYTPDTVVDSSYSDDFSYLKQRCRRDGTSSISLGLGGTPYARADMRVYFGQYS
ncbi:hypothetical protein NP233_g10228 [Leucocoprinus birnbaumii]|uniref:Calcineurin-like phosphoesterase domain-containing protein n=1 Tax=Leucocoprinus birnbaumii TaxID=56174 RepID=A0AAD5VJ17_9AGAR|nr:hypothetical protein NP233_g10228 [Leucocoprinus birnbaumii]